MYVSELSPRSPNQRPQQKTYLALFAKASICGRWNKRSVLVSFHQFNFVCRFHSLMFATRMTVLSIRPRIQWCFGSYSLVNHPRLVYNVYLKNWPSKKGYLLLLSLTVGCFTTKATYLKSCWKHWILYERTNLFRVVTFHLWSQLQLAAVTQFCVEMII